MGFRIAKDVDNNETWFIYNETTFHVLNVDDIKDAKYKGLFTKRSDKDLVTSTFSNKQDAQTVYDNLCDILKEKD